MCMITLWKFIVCSILVYCSNLFYLASADTKLSRYFDVLDGYTVTTVMSSIPAQSAIACSSVVLNLHHTYGSATYSRTDRMCRVSTDTSGDLVYSGDTDISTVLIKRVRSCADVKLQNQQASTGEHTIERSDGHEITVYCQFDGLTGYTFLADPLTIDLDIAALYTDQSRGVLVRHLTPDGSQYDVILQQLQYWKSVKNLTIAVINETISVVFAPESQVTVGITNGFSADGTSYDFLNCDTNPSSHIWFSFQSLASHSLDITGIGMPLFATSAQASDMLPSKFFTNMFAAFGGCGCSLSNHDLTTVSGSALGIPFTLT